MTSLVTPAVPAGTISALPQPTLGVAGLIIRPWLLDDSPDVLKAFSDPAIQQWHLLTLETRSEACKWIADRQKSWQDEKGANWAIADQSAQVIIGRVGLRDINLYAGQAEFTYWMLPHARGQGTAAQAVTAVTRWCFDKIGLHRLIITHSTANVASCKVAEKAGFMHEGTMISHLKHADGWHDMHIHGKTNTAHTC
jgi:[ribosomal protein S5]-alanine N-acetyltransferase